MTAVRVVVSLKERTTRAIARQVVSPSLYCQDMADKIWTAAELEKMTPAERREISQAAEVTDLATVDPEFLERARESARRHMAASEQTSPS